MMTPLDCDCARCRQMCANSTCLCSPEDVRRLHEAGYGDRLARYTFPAGQAIGPQPVGGGEQHSTTLGKACSMFSPERGCELHDKGLKPLEGRIAHHTRHWLPVRQAVLATWG